MKYKVGDKVIIRTWEDMKNEYGVGFDGDILFPKVGCIFLREIEKDINEINSDRILTIKEVIDDNYYLMESYTSKSDFNRIIGWFWSDYMIECLEEKYIPITSRFEIMDL